MNDKIIVFGTGMIGRATYEYLTKKGINIVGFSDNFNVYTERDFFGLQYYAPQKIPHDVLVIIATARTFHLEIKNQLESFGLNVMTVDEYIFALEKEKITQVRNLLYDDYSKSVFDEIIRFRTDCRTIFDAKYASAEQYFAVKEVSLGVLNRYRTNGFIMVDAGSCTGDWIERMFHYYPGAPARKVYAFEPGEKENAALKRRLRRLAEENAMQQEQFVVYDCFVGGKRGLVLEENGCYTNRSICNRSFGEVQNENGILIDTLDHLVTEQIDLIKADIEGMELEMLKGARQHIINDKPFLTICLYHKPWDYFEIPLYLKSLVPDYKFAIRHHTLDFGESVLYAWC